MTATIPTRKGRQQAAYLSWTDDSGAIQTLIFDVVEEEEWTGGSQITESPVESGADVTDNIRPSLRKVTLKAFATNEPIRSNQWANASFGQLDPIQLPAATWTVWPGRLDVLEWDSHLLERILANTAGGAIGSAVDGPLGGAIGGAVGSLVGGALFTPEVKHESVQIKPTHTPAKAQTISLFGTKFDDNDDYVQKTIDLLETLRSTSQTIDVFGTKTACIGAIPGIGGMAIETFTHTRNSGTGSGASLILALKEIRIATTTTVTAPKPSVPRAKKPVKKGNQEGTPLADEAAKAAAAFMQGIQDGSQATQSFFSGG